MTIQVVILAGGLATRLGKLSESKPKSLIPIKGSPFLDYQMYFLKSWGISKVHFCLGYLSESIEKHLKENYSDHFQITISRDGANQRGTGGALLGASLYLQDTFGLMYGDSYLTMNLVEALKEFENRKQNLMCVTRNVYPECESNVRCKSGYVIEYGAKKGKNFEYIDYGFSFFKKVDLLKNDIEPPVSLSTLLRVLIQEKNLLSRIVDEPFFEIGTKFGIERFEQYLDSISK